MNWKEIYDATIQICEDDPGYGNYAAREKMLAFSFTFIQQLNKNPEIFAPVFRKTSPVFLVNAASLRELKKEFDAYAENLIQSASLSGEVQARPLVSSYYHKVLWTGFVFILSYWSKDRSDKQESTDVVIEKTVHFMFDALSPNAIDSGIDLVRFLFQLRKSS